MELRAGARLHSATDSTEVAVVAAPSEPVDLRCGGAPMLPLGEDGAAGDPAPGFDEGTAVGKRYADDATGLEVLCTKAGPGSLSLGDQRLEIKGAKALPSSD